MTPRVACGIPSEEVRVGLLSGLDAYGAGCRRGPRVGLTDHRSPNSFVAAVYSPQTGNEALTRIAASLINYPSWSH
jgi:hypothetical protein